MSRELAFYLKGRPNGGGANSVIQEFSALVTNYGMGYLVVAEEHLPAFRLSYGWDERVLVRVKTSLEDLPEDVIPIATTNDSVREVREVFSERGVPILYYVQDYEPLFYAAHSDQQRVARESYGHVNDVVAVVKTDWLKQTLLRETFLPVVKIRPSINRKFFFPDPSRPAEGRRMLLAMVRPSTPRRAPGRTVAIINRLASEAHDRVDIAVFGADNRELQSAGLTLNENVQNFGRLSQAKVADLVRSAHYFVDISDYQAFGRGLAEAMACGTVPLATRYGAPPEFIRLGESGLLLDPSELESVWADVMGAIEWDWGTWRELSLRAMSSVAPWSVEATCSDWLALVEDFSGGW